MFCGVDDVAVLIPVLGRPHTIADVTETLRGRDGPEIVFIATVGDTEVLTAIRDIAVGASDITLFTMPRCTNGDYARKINYAARTLTNATTFFLGASDLRFHDGWLETGLAYFTEGVEVVGTNDLGNRRVTEGQHSTHSFVTRRYMEEFGTIDEPGKILHEGYVHEFVDDELIGTAKKRGVYVWAGDCHVEHLHPYWGKAPMDEMYARSNHRMRASRSRYNRRRRLWR